MSNKGIGNNKRNALYPYLLVFLTDKLCWLNPKEIR
jgi:hypothetical protein